MANSPNDRYQKPLQVHQLPNGKQVYKSAIPKKFNAPIGESRFYQSNETLRLDNISQQAYNTPADWYKIASAYGKFNGSMFLPKGETIYIP